LFYAIYFFVIYLALFYPANEHFNVSIAKLLNEATPADRWLLVNDHKQFRIWLKIREYTVLEKENLIPAILSTKLFPRGLQMSNPITTTTLPNL
jgi:hypothetical protein